MGSQYLSLHGFIKYLYHLVLFLPCLNSQFLCRINALNNFNVYSFIANFALINNELEKEIETVKELSKQKIESERIEKERKLKQKLLAADTEENK